MTQPSSPLSRIHAFDIMRGYFLIAIVLNHLYYYPNGLDWVAMRGNLFVSSAEGFFFVSGIVLGIVRGAKLINQPLRRVTQLLLQRSFQLYTTSVVLMLIFTFLGWQFFMDNPGLKYGIQPSNSNIWQFLWGTLTFQYFYGWADYLRLYCLFIGISPVAMWLLRRGQWYIVAAMSLGVWAFSPVTPAMPFEQQELYQPLSWQILFFGGLIVGFHWLQLTKIWQNLSHTWRRYIIGGVLLATFVTLLGNIVIEYGIKLAPSDITQGWYEWRWELYPVHFHKEGLPWERLVLFITWFSAAFWLVRRFEPVIIRWLGWLLLPFGTNSLYVYTLHAFLIFFVHLFIPQTTWWANFLIAISLIGVLRLAIYYKFLMKVIPR